MVYQCPQVAACVPIHFHSQVSIRVKRLVYVSQVWMAQQYQKILLGLHILIVWNACGFDNFHSARFVLDFVRTAHAALANNDDISILAPQMMFHL